MAYSGDYTQMEDIPYKIVPGVNPRHRESVFLERAIAGERVRLAMGLSLQPVQQRTMLSEGMGHAAIAEQYTPVPRNGIRRQDSARAVLPRRVSASVPWARLTSSTARAASIRKSASNAANAPRPARITRS